MDFDAKNLSIKGDYVTKNETRNSLGFAAAKRQGKKYELRLSQLIIIFGVSQLLP